MTMSKVLTICCVTALALAVALGLWLLKPKINSVAQQIREPPSPHQQVPPGNAQPVMLPPQKTERPQTLGEALEKAPDFVAASRQILARAKAGDADAQYNLWWLRQYCDHAGGAFAHDRSGRALNWDEAVQAAAAMNLQPDRVKSDYDRCHRFYSEDVSDLGGAAEWLQRATDARYAPAETQTAKLRLSQERLKAFVRAGAVPTGDALLPPIGGDIDPRDLLRDAVTSLNPNIIQQIGDLMPRLVPSSTSEQDKVITRAAWVYVSCLRGADCSNYGASSMSNCAPTDQNCIGIPEGLLKWVNYNWDPVQERANEINAALDAKQWDKLGL